MVWRIEPGEQLRDAFRRVALEEIAKVRGGFFDPTKDRARAIHEARQGFKRLRALLRLAEPSLGSAFARENRRWRDAARRLSGLRDQTVLVESFESLLEDGVAGLSPEGVDVLRPCLALNGNAARGPGVEASVRAVIAMIDKAAPRYAKLKWPADSATLAKGLRLSQSRLKASWKAARDDPGPLALHEWRKRVKDQSAQMRLFRNIVPSPLKQRHTAEKRTAVLLGDEHDLWMLAEHLRPQSMPEPAAAAREALLRAIEARRRELQNEAFRLGGPFSAQSKKVFAAEMVAAWEAASARAAPDRVRQKLPATSQAS